MQKPARNEPHKTVRFLRVLGGKKNTVAAPENLHAATAPPQADYSELRPFPLPASAGVSRSLGLQLPGKRRRCTARSLRSMHAVGILKLHRRRAASVGELHLLKYLRQ